MNVLQQRWNIYDDGRIRSKYSWKCLSLDENRNGKDLVLRWCNGSDEQNGALGAFQLLTPEAWAFGIGMRNVWMLKVQA